MPSPTIATRRPAACSFRICRHLTRRAAPRPARDRCPPRAPPLPPSRARSPVIIHTSIPIGSQAAHRFRRFRLDGVGNLDCRPPPRHPPSRWRPACPTTTSRPATRARTPWPACAEKPAVSSSARPRLGAASTIALPSGCSEYRSADAARRSTSFSVEHARCRVTRGHARLAARDGARFIQHHGVDLVRHLQRFAALDQDAALGAAPRPHHDRRRRRQTQRARAGDDQHRHGVHHGRGERREEQPRRRK